MGNILVKHQKHMIFPMGHYSSIFFGFSYDYHYEKLIMASKLKNSEFLVELVEDLLDRKIRISILQKQYKGVLCRINIYEISSKKHEIFLGKMISKKYEIQKVDFLGTYFNVLNSRTF